MRDCLTKSRQTQTAPVKGSSAVTGGRLTVQGGWSLDGVKCMKWVPVRIQGHRGQCPYWKVPLDLGGWLVLDRWWLLVKRSLRELALRKNNSGVLRRCWFKIWWSVRRCQCLERISLSWPWCAENLVIILTVLVQLVRGGGYSRDVLVRVRALFKALLRLVRE